MTMVRQRRRGWPRRASFLGCSRRSRASAGVVFLPLAGVMATVDWQPPFWLYAVAVVILPFALLALDGTPRADKPSAAADHSPNTLPVDGISALALVATLAFYLAPTQPPFLLTDFDVGPAVVGIVVAGSTPTGTVGALVFPVLDRRLTPTAITTGSIFLLGPGWPVIGLAGSVVLVVAGLLVGGVGVGLGHQLPALVEHLGRAGPRTTRTVSGTPRRMPSSTTVTASRSRHACRDGEQAIEAVRAYQPEVLLLDPHMPKLDGIQVAREFCGDTATRVLILTTFDKDTYVYDALHAGASGFLLKDV